MSNRLFNDNEFDQHFARTEKHIKRGFFVFGIAWVISFILGLAITGVLVWAIIRLVMKYT